jgi:hypothetical protein
MIRLPLPEQQQYERARLTPDGLRDIRQSRSPLHVWITVSTVYYET